MSRYNDFPQTVTTNSGAIIKLRRIERKDSYLVKKLNRAIVKKGEGVVLNLNEVPDDDLFWDKKVAGWLKYRNNLFIAAEELGKIIGTADISRMNANSLAHNGILTIGVHPEKQGQGVGRLLFNAVMEWAKRETIYRITLYTLANNNRAIELFCSGGFRKIQLRKNFVIINGQPFDDVVMEWISTKYKLSGMP